MPTSRRDPVPYGDRGRGAFRNPAPRARTNQMEATHLEESRGAGRDALAIYLKDHHAAGSAGARLAARVAANVSADVEARG